MHKLGPKESKIWYLNVWHVGESIFVILESQGRNAKVHEAHDIYVVFKVEYSFRWDEQKYPWNTNDKQAS